MEIEDSQLYDAFNTPLSLFKRVRRVNVDEDGTMFCSCQRFETTGIFCSHQDSVAFAVSNEIGIDWEGFTPIMTLLCIGGHHSCTLVTNNLPLNLF